MKLLKEIRNSDVGLKNVHSTKYKLRRAARGILRKEDEIALMFNSSKQFYKLPGGGLDENEKVEDALKREMLEETGCICQIDDEIGAIIECKDETEFMQISYVYLCTLVSDTGKLNLSDNEIAEGVELRWVSLTTAIELITSDENRKNRSAFGLLRDLTVIDEAKAQGSIQ